MSHHCQLVGILNITPDSFSDGGEYDTPTTALEKATSLIKEGATILDIGAQSTRPGAAIVTAEEEWQRLEPVITLLQNASLPATISIDSYHPETITRAVTMGVDWINDVSGCTSQKTIDAIVDSSVKIVVMHSLTLPADPTITIEEDQDPITVIMTWAESLIATLTSKGIAKERIIIDPGLGFGKTASQSFNIIQGIDRLRALSVPILVGHSRKSFLNLFTQAPAAERDLETAILSGYLAKKVDFLRIHNVAYSQRAITLQQAL